MRLFVALDIDDPIRERIQLFMEGVRGFAPDVRWVRPEALHITLKFIGERPDESRVVITQALSGIRIAPVQVAFRGCGFFPTPKAPRVFWIGIEAGAELGQLAVSVDESLHALGIEKEEHGFHPHLTLARRGAASGSPRRQGGDAPNNSFSRLQEKLKVLGSPEFGTMTAREFFLYQSQLSSGGSRYTKLEQFPLA